jgi:FkbM family methyltransferase
LKLDRCQEKLLSVKTLVAGAICHPYVGNMVSLLLRDRIRHHGCPIDTTSSCINPRTKATLFWGFYEGAETRFVQRYLRSDLDVIELGSSIGVISSHIARKLDSPRRLICVEANPALIEILKRNVQLNRPDLNLTIVNAAVSYDNHDAFVPFALEDDTTASRLGGQTDEVIQVQTVTLESIIADHNIQRYSLVCDIEGAEAGFIMNGSDTLRLCQQLIIEFHRTPWHGVIMSVEELAQHLRNKHGFSTVDQYGPVYVFQRLDR